MILSKLFYRFLGVLFLCLIFSASADAQLKKGDYHVDFQSSVAYSTFFIQKPIISGEVTWLKMFSDRWMAGANLYYLHNHVRVSNFEGSEDFTYHTYRISPMVRYYFRTRRFSPFASLENVLQYNTLDDEVRFSENLSGYQMRLGIGVDYFLRPNIAVEGLLATNPINTGKFKEISNTLSLNLGLKLFFNDRFFTKTQALPDRILQKGNIISTTGLLSDRRFGDRKYTRTSISANARYFLTDRLNIYGSYGNGRIKTSFSVFNSIRLSLGAAYYVRLTNELYWNFEAGSTIGLSGDKYFKAVENGIKTFNVPLSTSLHYFIGPAKIYGGVRYISNFNRTVEGTHENTSYTYRMFAGVDYYVSDYVFVNANFLYSTLKIKDRMDTNQSGGLSLGVGFIIGKGGMDKKEEL